MGIHEDIARLKAKRAGLDNKIADLEAELVVWEDGPFKIKHIGSRQFALYREGIYQMSYSTRRKALTDGKRLVAIKKEWDALLARCLKLYDGDEEDFWDSHDLPHTVEGLKYWLAWKTG